jgi:ATP-binding cassette subfamily F protein uup
MALFTFLDVTHGFGGPPLLDNVSFQMDPGERICVLGRNGSGKSTFLKIIDGEMRADTGLVSRQPGTVFRRLPQEIPTGLAGTVREVVASGCRTDPGHHEEEWERDLRLDALLERVGVPGGATFDTLSGGLKRRTLLARALAAEPDLLLLDEPTNHLDIDAIAWLEEFLIGARVALVFVTHDRMFLRRLATRIIELDRGRLTNWACDYETYLVRKEEFLAAEERQNAAADKKLAQEEAWVRRGVRAQRTRAQARIEALVRLRAERRARRERVGNATLRLDEAALSGVKVVETENAAFSHPGGPPLLHGLTTSLTRGDKIGIIGPNGSGKTTLVRLLLGELAPTAGTVTHGTGLQVVYLDQLRAGIDDNRSIAENVADGATTVTVGGRSRHVLSYLQDFLFTPDRARTPARVLSGGERNRLLLARLFTRPANVLVLDEPTNDLDLETLDILEDLLVEYSGTLIVVSHDRDFLDNVVTSTLVLEGGGKVAEYVGGWSDWNRARERARPAPPAPQAPAPRPAAPPKPRKLNKRERDELDALPRRIEEIESEQAAITARLADPQTYQRDPTAAVTLRQRLDELEAAHAAAFTRWEELEALKSAGGG